MVCMCHMYVLFPSFCAQETRLPITVNVLQTLGILGVPLFVMATGTLVLSKRFVSRKDVGRFYKKNILSLYVTGAVWSVLYQVFATPDTTWTDILLSIFFVRKPAPHLWYMRMILLYYLFIPFLSYLFLYKRGITATLLFFSLSVFLASGVKMLVLCSSCPTSPGWSMMSYLTYLYVGFWVSSLDRPLRKSLCLLSFLLSIGLLVFIRHCGLCSFLWYDNPLVLSASIGLYLLLYGTKVHRVNTRAGKWFKKLSAMTFGVYLSHYAILLLASGCQPSFMKTMLSVNPDTVAYVLLLVVCCFCTLAFSFLFVHLVMCIPFLSRLLVRA